MAISLNRGERSQEGREKHSYISPFSVGLISRILRKNFFWVVTPLSNRLLQSLGLGEGYMESNVMNLNLRMHSDRIGKERSRIWECQTAGIDSFVNIQPIPHRNRNYSAFKE